MSSILKPHNKRFRFDIIAFHPHPECTPHTTSTTNTTATPILQAQTAYLHRQRTFVFACGLAEGKASAFEPTSCLCLKAAEWEFQFSEPAKKKKKTGWSRPFKDSPIFIYLLVKLTRKSSEVQWSHTTDVRAADRNVVLIAFSPDQCSTDLASVGK